MTRTYLFVNKIKLTLHIQRYIQNTNSTVEIANPEQTQQECVYILHTYRKWKEIKTIVSNMRLKNAIKILKRFLHVTCM